MLRHVLAEACTVLFAGRLTYSWSRWCRHEYEHYLDGTWKSLFPTDCPFSSSYPHFYLFISSLIPPFFSFVLETREMFYAAFFVVHPFERNTKQHFNLHEYSLLHASVINMLVTQHFTLVLSVCVFCICLEFVCFSDPLLSR